MGRHELDQAAPETTKLALADAKEAAYDAKEANREAARADTVHAADDAHLMQRKEPTTLKIAHAAERVWDKMMDATVKACDAIVGKPPADPALPPAEGADANAGLVEMRQVPAEEKVDEKRIAKDTWDVAKDTASGLKQAIITEPIAQLKHEAPKPRKHYVKPNNTVQPVLDNVAKKGAELTDNMREAGVEGWENTKQMAEDMSERLDKAGNLPLKNQARRNRRARKAMKQRSYAEVAAAAPEIPAAGETTA